MTTAVTATGEQGHSIWQWIADEALLTQLMAEQSTFVLLVIIVVCIALLSKGADWMIDGVVDLARRTGLPKIVIGATVVSLGTTLPEAFVSVMAAYMGNPGLALGNGVGSIIADTGLIFGLTAILIAVPVNRYILNRTGWVQVGAATLLVLLALLMLDIDHSGQVAKIQGPDLATRESDGGDAARSPRDLVDEVGEAPFGQTGRQDPVERGRIPALLQVPENGLPHLEEITALFLEERRRETGGTDNDGAASRPTGGEMGERRRRYGEVHQHVHRRQGGFDVGTD